MRRLLGAALLSVAAVVLLARGAPANGARSPLAAHGPVVAPEPEPLAVPVEPAAQDIPVEGAEPVAETGWLDQKRVRIVDAASRAGVDGACAWVLLFDGCELQDTCEAVSDAHGEALLKEGFGGDVALLVRKRGYSAHFAWLKYGDLPETVELVAGLPLRGRVMLADGRPGAGAMVYAWDAETQKEIVHDPRRTRSWEDDTIATDPEGVFEIDGVVPGRPFVLAVLLPGYGVYRAVHEAQPELEIRLGRGATLEGRVYDGAGVLQPGAEAFVELEKEDGDYDFNIDTPFCLNARAVADDQGRFRIVGIEPGRYVVTASVDYWARGASEPVDLRSVGDVQWRDVSVERAASLKVRFADPPEGRRFRWDLRDTDGRACRSRFWSDSWREGRSYDRDGIHAGTYRLTVRFDGRYLLDRVVELRPGETLDLEIPAYP